ncbi:myelin-associated glycoprotein-like [Puntigrus tetrazona]|uniref:myelin-associated glycoprotein-like n=1 Tax=Puntigrus tetrazona TaxID=1606681 RepID=UPI001C89D6FD|nr:myelin-associated glycoprotein-like [Puntigrus tetrazona]
MLQTLLFILTVITTTNCELLHHDAPTNFSIEVAKTATGEAGLCILVYCFFTLPQNVSHPIKRTWFKGDPQNSSVEVPNFMSNTGRSKNEEECSFFVNQLVQGESDGQYRLKLEWGKGNVYVFPETVNITVKELTQKPTIIVPQLTAGEKAEISCKVPGDCRENVADIVWTGIRSNNTGFFSYGVPSQYKQFSKMTFYPKSEHHNTELTCTVTLKGHIRTESTVILKVKYSPIILNSSHCLMRGDELSCMCVSSAVPLPQIYWPILNDTAKYYSAVSKENIISISNISIPGFGNVNATVECVSENLIGTTKMEIIVHKHGEKSQEISGGLSTVWILFTLSVALNVIFASCLIVFVVRRRQKYIEPKHEDHIYMTAMKREESVYETIKM